MGSSNFNERQHNAITASREFWDWSALLGGIESRFPGIHLSSLSPAKGTSLGGGRTFDRPPYIRNENGKWYIFAARDLGSVTETVEKLGLGSYGRLMNTKSHSQGMPRQTIPTMRSRQADATGVSQALARRYWSEST